MIVEIGDSDDPLLENLDALDKRGVKHVYHGDRPPDRLKP